MLLRLVHYDKIKRNFNLLKTADCVLYLKSVSYSEELRGSKLTFFYKGGEIQKVSVNSEPLLGVKKNRRGVLLEMLLHR